MKELKNSFCSVEYNTTEKQIDGRDFRDTFNLPAFYTKSKRGLDKAWQAISDRWNDTLTIHDVINICRELGIKTHYWCMMD